MTQTTPGWHTPGQAPDPDQAGNPQPDSNDTAALPTTVDAQEFVAPTPPPPPPPTWYGETAPLPTTPRLATQPAAARITAGLLKRNPALLTLGAILSGKTQSLGASRHASPAPWLSRNG